MSFFKPLFFTIALISTISFTVQAKINVVASVKPVHSLVSGVMDGVGKPALIVKGSASPHTYSLKPSQAQQIEEADLVFWMGHELESFLEKPLEAIATKAKVVELIDSDELKKLDMREGGAFDDHGHDDNTGHIIHIFEILLHQWLHQLQQCPERLLSEEIPLSSSLHIRGYQRTIVR